MIQNSAKRIMHFCLSPNLCSARSDEEWKSMTVNINGRKYPLKRHSKETLAQAVRDNRAIAFLSESAQEKITAYAEIENGVVNRQALSMVMVQEEREDGRLPVLHHFSYFIPEKYHASVREQRQKVQQGMGETEKQSGICAKMQFLEANAEKPDIQTLKTLVGTPDELIEEGMLQDITAEPEMMSREREMEMLHADRNAFLGETCQAFRSYIYGYSPKAKSYEKVINALRFPTSVETYEIPELHIRRGEVYEFGKDDPEKHMAVIIDKLTMEEDARIISYCYADITVNQGQTKNDSVIGNCGTDGKDGITQSGTGVTGNTGTKGSNSKSGKKSCDVNAGKGGVGGPGQPGKDGGNGGNGGSGSTLTCTFSHVEGTFPRVCCSGGKGGSGGVGGEGGDGGAGSAPGAVGTPGKSGDSGNSGDAGKINITQI